MYLDKFQYLFFEEKMVIWMQVCDEIFFDGVDVFVFYVLYMQVGIGYDGVDVYVMLVCDGGYIYMVDVIFVLVYLVVFGIGGQVLVFVYYEIQCLLLLVFVQIVIRLGLLYFVQQCIGLEVVVQCDGDQMLYQYVQWCFWYWMLFYVICCDCILGCDGFYQFQVVGWYQCGV